MIHDHQIVPENIKYNEIVKILLFEGQQLMIFSIVIQLTILLVVYQIRIDKLIRVINILNENFT